MKLRHIFLATAVVLAAGAASAQDVVKSGRILEALTSKDIVLDSTPPRPGAPRPAAARPRSPSIDLQVQFALNSADLLPIGQMQLDELALALSDRALASDGFEITGHTDRSGDPDSNLRLSLERAAAVRNYLVTRHGLSPARLMTAGLGASRLADAGNPNAAINRRVEIRRIAAMPAFGGGNVVSSPLVPTATGGRLVPTPQ